MIEKRTGKKMAAKIFNLGANTRDNCKQQVKSYDYDL